MTLKIDFSGLDKKLSSIVNKYDEITDQALKETAEQAVKIIVARTRRKSVDKDGNSFVPYSESYLNSRKKAGASKRVILTSTGSTVGSGNRGKLKGNKQGGQMLNSLAAERVDKGEKYVITVARGIEAVKLTRHVRGEGNLPKRNPMGFTTSEEKLLINRTRRQIKFKIGKLGNK